jgi:hypothetical protein
MKKSELIALIDMDGTMVDYNSTMLAKLEELRSPFESPVTKIEGAPDYIERRMELIKNNPGYWKSLPLIEEGIKIIDLFRELQFILVVLTKGPKRCSTAWTEKYEWCMEHLPDASVTITQDKGGQYGKVLFDDWPPYITRWLEWRPRGLVLMLDQPWNQDFEQANLSQNIIRVYRKNHLDYEKRMEYIKSRLRELIID